MNLLVISDLHIGNNDMMETFGWKSSKFIKALEMVIAFEKIDKVIFNGDVFELYKYSFAEIMNTNKQLANFILYDNRFEYLKGNHDAICKFGKDSFLIKNSLQQDIYIEHGHSADFLNGSRFGQKIQALGFGLLRLLAKNKWVYNIYLKIHLWSESINTIPEKYDSIKYLSHALRLLKDHDVVILGHTHKIEAHKTYYQNQKKNYINCGSCSMGRFQGVVINTDSLAYETLKFKNYKDLRNHYLNMDVPKMVIHQHHPLEVRKECA